MAGMAAFDGQLSGCCATARERSLVGGARCLPQAGDNPRYDGGGEVEVDMSDPVPDNGAHLPVDNAGFYRRTTLEDLLAGAEPLRSVHDLIIEDLTDEEADRFYAALEG